MAIATRDDLKGKLSSEEASSQLFELLEEHFDELKLSLDERDDRYARAEQRTIREGAAGAKSAA